LMTPPGGQPNKISSSDTGVNFSEIPLSLMTKWPTA
jgi:hypothetical protein